MPGYTNPQNLNRYSYVTNNPLRYTDPTGHKPCELVCEGDIINWTEANQGSAWEGEWDIKKQKKNEKKAEAILYGGAELLAGILFEPADWASTGYHCLTGDCSAWSLLGLVPGIPGSLGRHADDIIDSGGTVTRVFWSGGDEARRAAELWAKANNAVTLEMSEIGQRVNQMTQGMSWKEARSLWEAASEKFAQGASGEVHAFLGSAVNYEHGMWATIEYPLLLVNDAVTAIIPHAVP